MLQFHPLSLSDQRYYSACYEACEEKSSDYSFMNIWTWLPKYHFEVAYADNLCWLRTPSSDGFLYYAPVGAWGGRDWYKIFRRNFEADITMVRIPGTLAGFLGAQLPDSKLISQREHWEYVYSVADLIKLSGERFSTKRKLANYFRRSFNYTERNLKPSDTETILKFQDKWLDEQPHRGRGVMKSLKTEAQALRQLLMSWSDFSNLRGQGIWVDRRLVGFSIVETVTPEMLIVHFEKALTAYKGLYQALNQITLENNNTYTWVNREQDLGLPGLRKAKQEYRPAYMIRKYKLIY